MDIGILEGRLTILDFDCLNAVPLERDPFDFVVVEEFVRKDALAAVIADFPAVGKAGSYPVDGLKYGPAFGELAAELTGPDLADAIAAKFGIDLDEPPDHADCPRNGRFARRLYSYRYRNKNHYAAALYEPGLATQRRPIAVAA